MNDHFRRWNEWRKHNRNGKSYQLLVLLGFVSSPTYCLTLLPEEIEKIKKEAENEKQNGN